MHAQHSEVAEVPTTSPKSRPVHALAAAVAVSTAAALLAGCGNNSETKQPAPLLSFAARDAAVQSDLDTIVDAGVAGMIATLTADGHTTTLTSGVSNRDTAQPFPQNAQVRIGSITKSFTAAILMQLVSEGKLNLDDPIDTYLPGMVSGDGVDGRNITVRQILQHRSGVPEFAGDPRTDELIAASQRRTVSPDEALSVALEKPAQFPPELSTNTPTPTT